MTVMKTLQRPALVALLTLGLALPAAAADSLSLRLAHGLGHAIASQGNIAFQNIRADVQRELADRFSAWLPQAAPLSRPQPTGDASGSLDELLEWHEESVATSSATPQSALE